MLKAIAAGVSLAVVAMATIAVAQTAGAPSMQRGDMRAPGAPRYGTTPEEWNNNNALGKAWVAKAKETAGSDPDLVFDYNIFCSPSAGSNATDRQSLGVPNSEPHLTPFPAPKETRPMPGQRLFDNFYWFGDTGVGAWLITTPDGYILFDALNNAEEARDVLFPEMRKKGLDPAKIKYMIFGHYHLDHTGGGQFVQSQVHPKVIMGRDDWNLYYKSLQSTTGLGARLKDRTPMERGIDATDGMKITLGGLTATIYQMTGHTPGSIGMVVPVKYQGKEHPILLVTAATDVHNWESFVGGYEHIWDQGIKDKVESVMQVHPNTNMNLLARTTYVDEHYPPAKNPLLYGAVRTQKYINIMRYCTLARMEALGWSKL